MLQFLRSGQIFARLFCQNGHQIAHQPQIVCIKMGLYVRNLINHIVQTKVLKNIPRGTGLRKDIAFGQNGLNHLGQFMIACKPGNIGHNVQGIRIRGQHFQYFVTQLFDDAFINRHELGADARFARELAQNGPAKRMDGLNFQSAGCFDGLGKQGARLPQCGIVDDIIHAHFSQRLPQRIIGLHRPAAQPFKQAVLHFGGRRLGIGQTQDVFG